MSLPLAGRQVAVLMGGLSPEREVSLTSGRACADALDRLGARVARIDAGRDIAAVLAELRPEVCFNALHGEWGEDGCVQGVLETLALPYTHSGVLASALAMDKAKAKAVLAAAGVRVPGGGLFDRHDAGSRHVLPPPYVVKPNAQGSSVGVFRVFEGANSPPTELLSDQLAPRRDGDGRALYRRAGAGRRGDGRPRPGGDGDRGGDRLLRLRGQIRRGRFDSPPAGEASGGGGGAGDGAGGVRPHRPRRCRGVSRSDLRYDGDKDDLVLLEVNTQPGMTPTSLVPEQATHMGLSFDDLVLWITLDGLRRV